MKKYRKSRKGMTLVELVVTVAILGIVSGLSLTIVVSAMNNYSEAAILEKEQNVALLLEENIVRYARVASIVKRVDNSSNTTAHLPKNSLEFGFYIAKVGDNIETFEYEKNAAGTGGVQYTRLKYEGIKNLTFSVCEQKSKKNPSSTDLISCYLNYQIETQSGYVLKGQTVLNNATAAKMESNSAGYFKITRTSTNYIDQSAELDVIRLEEVSGGGETIVPAYDVAVVFD